MAEMSHLQWMAHWKKVVPHVGLLLMAGVNWFQGGSQWKNIQPGVDLPMAGRKWSLRVAKEKKYQSEAA